MKTIEINVKYEQILHDFQMIRQGENLSKIVEYHSNRSYSRYSCLFSFFFIKDKHETNVIDAY
jgi:hypothetical protein